MLVVAGGHFFLEHANEVDSELGAVVASERVGDEAGVHRHLHHLKSASHSSTQDAEVRQSARHCVVRQLDKVRQRVLVEHQRKRPCRSYSCCAWPLDTCCRRVMHDSRRHRQERAEGDLCVPLGEHLWRRKATMRSTGVQAHL